MTEEVSIDVIKKTQKTLGKYIKKPPLTEKLLRKPPFRFLHDVIVTLVKETGFLKGLFSEEELVSDNVKNKDAKVAFLTKIIEAVKTLTTPNLTVKAGKIVAGLEPTNTNLLLQAIAKSIDSKIDTSQYVLKIKSNNKNEKNKKNNTKPDKPISVSKTHTEVEVGEKGSIKYTEKKSETPKNKKASSFRKDEDTKVKTRKPSKSEDKVTKKLKVGKESPKIEKEIGDNDKEESKNEPNSKEINIKEDSSRKEVTDTSNSIIIEPSEIDMKNTENASTSEINESVDKNMTNIVVGNTKHIDGENATNIVDENIKNINNKNIVEVEAGRSNTEIGENVYKNLVRPKSARPKSGDKDKLKSATLQGKPSKQEGSKFMGNDLNLAKPLSRPKSSLRPPSVRPSSARPGAPRLRPDSAFPMQEPVPMGTINVIVENVDSSAPDEEETVIIENGPVELDGPPEASQVELDTKGHLVEQILEQIEGDVMENKKKTDIDWEIVRSKEGSAKTLTHLAGMIQNLTKTANPLGKLINFVHEDIEAMHSELELWIHTKKQLYADIRKQKMLNVESNKPLLAHLEQLNQETKKIQQEITHINCNILKNDTRIKDLLCR